MKISTASLSLSLLTLALTSPLGGCYTYEEGGDPIAGSAPAEVVSTYFEDAYFLISYPDGGPTREVITYNPKDGQVCMAIRETLTPLAEDDATPIPAEDPTVDDGGWIILTAQVDREILDDGKPYLVGGVFWYDEIKGFDAFGEFQYAPENLSIGLQLTTSIWPTTKLLPDPTNITAVRGALPSCEALKRPDFSASPYPEPTQPPQPTPI